jgi:ADP-heptose:LPS heptosyltransferase
MKRWGAEHYLALARSLANAHGCHVVLLGDDNDAALTGAIAAELGERCTDVAGRTTLMETAAWIRRCDGFVGNDSGLMHLSEAVGVPVLGLFGPTVDAFGYYPTLPESKTVERALPCRPCSRNGSRPCPRATQECLAGIDAAFVEAVVVDMLERRGARRYQLQ